ncbi:Fimbria A protein precursor [Serratia quinivorans]|uniref:fimbrial protein n=1 Tax=Serratia TaxID=613 RepID=UPI001F4C080F|nr:MULTISPECIES: fimbrial protein [Serratia]ULG13836.1 fimbria A protein [Serratia proteamaculans]ULG13978.1 fimbria A protein [Serratia proteamaculans]ULG14333.1 fimbria A protein [Serratia proteamaculans]ULG14957.1 fimbria A protein [Serratia proteamaculans]ULG15396.1 fimbria A protein [Serratia proteamaculans]
MKLNKIMLLVSLTLGAASFAHAADEGHGTVTFTGSIIDAPCSITAETSDQTVRLGQVSSVALLDGGKSTPQAFSIDLENCNVELLSEVTTTFTGGESAVQPGLLGIVGTASGASIAITDSSGELLPLGQASAAHALQEGNNTLLFSAYLQGDSTTVVPGEFQSVADFTLAYN